MIGLLRRGDDGLTDRQRRRESERYWRTVGRRPSADVIARAMALPVTSLRLQGSDADVTARPPAVATSSTGTACQDGATAGAGAGQRMPAPATLHWLPAMVPHTHRDRFERDACEAEHLAVMGRLLRLAVA